MTFVNKIDIQIALRYLKACIMGSPKENRQGIENFNHGEIQEQYILAPLRELDLENESDLTAYFQILTHTANIEHFSGPPEDPSGFKTKINPR